MAGLMAVSDAAERIRAAVTRMPAETVPLRAALSRVLAEDAMARRTQPPADLSAMDGYAVRAADLAALPARLHVVETIPAGATPQRTLQPGQSARIFTGALVPAGADAVVLQENCDAAQDAVIVREGAVKPGQHIRPAGMDFREGDSVLNRGMKLAARHIAMLSAMDISAVPVVRRPRIAVLATGDELVRPGEVRGPAQIVAASLDGLLAQLALWGAEPIDLGIARDDAQAIAAAAGRAGDADMLITLGGASVGDHDLVRAALAPGGLSLEFWKIAMRPGKPLMFGTYRGKPFLGLPGNPVSTLVCSILFVQSAIAKMSGDVSSPIETWPEAALNTPLPANDQRMDFLRAQMVEAGRVRPFARQDSSELSALSSADVLICRPPFDPAKAEGDMVNVMYLGQR